MEEDSAIYSVVRNLYIGQIKKDAGVGTYTEH